VRNFAVSCLLTLILLSYSFYSSYYNIVYKIYAKFNDVLSRFHNAFVIFKALLIFIFSFVSIVSFSHETKRDEDVRSCLLTLLLIRDYVFSRWLSCRIRAIGCKSRGPRKKFYLWVSKDEESEWGNRLYLFLTEGGKSREKRSRFVFKVRVRGIFLSPDFFPFRSDRCSLAARISESNYVSIAFHRCKPRSATPNMELLPTTIIAISKKIRTRERQKKNRM